MGTRVDRAARVGRVVHKDGAAVLGLGGQGLHVLHIYLPGGVREEVVKDRNNSAVVTEGLVKGEAGAGKEDAVAFVGEDGDGHVQGAGAAAGEHDVVGVERRCLGLEAGGHCGTGVGKAAGVCVAVDLR